jgi:soluble lytic murein transglycosylase
MARLAVLLFFIGPAALVAAAISVRTVHAVESWRTVMDRMAKYGVEARAASASEGVELPLLLAVACSESAGRPAARSGAGAVGLMQLTESTAAEMARARGEPHPELTDSATSLRLGARYLRRQLDRNADSPFAKEMALAAYNAGPANVASWRRDGEPADREALQSWTRFSETRSFVQRVLEYEARWRVQLDSQTAAR